MLKENFLKFPSKASSFHKENLKCIATSLMQE